ncbi:MAG: serine/threonine-protein kinase [Minicystis sp.]
MICPECHRAYDDPHLRFCVDDGARLVDGPAVRISDVRPTAELGQLVAGRYAIKGFLGEGGMARVYLAEDAKSGAPVAVKILRREQVGNRLARERFLREVDAAAHIDHPNVVRILDAGERADRAPFLVLEFLAGETVADLLDREPFLREDFALPVGRSAASALAAAHAAGVVHRDVKPENLFLVAGGGLKVVDFGVAKLKEGVVTAAGMALGTVPYMAPEQALADPIDGRTDVYGLGITLFHMLTGRLPFDHEDDARTTAELLYVAAPRPSALRPGIDPRIDAVVLAAVRKRPELRYPSMAALLADLERLLGERDGDIDPPASATADVYEPQNPMSRTAARFFRGLVQRDG